MMHRALRGIAEGVKPTDDAETALLKVKRNVNQELGRVRRTKARATQRPALEGIPRRGKLALFTTSHHVNHHGWRGIVCVAVAESSLTVAAKTYIVARAKMNMRSNSLYGEKEELRRESWDTPQGIDFEHVWSNPGIVFFHLEGQWVEWTDMVDHDVIAEVVGVERWG